uniref:Uncharacterized protein n=1 Tax=Rhizophora mucronata TaxID=61149 RepID=A0A2P2IIQ0_RHIMU
MPLVAVPIALDHTTIFCCFCVEEGRYRAQKCL